MRASSLLTTSGDKDKAKAELDYITKAFPQNPEARYMVGALALQQKDFAKAAETFGALHRKTPRISEDCMAWWRRWRPRISWPTR